MLTLFVNGFLVNVCKTSITFSQIDVKECERERLRWVESHERLGYDTVQSV